MTAILNAVMGNSSQGQGSGRRLCEQEAKTRTSQWALIWALALLEVVAFWYLGRWIPVTMQFAPLLLTRLSINCHSILGPVTVLKIQLTGQQTCPPIMGDDQKMSPMNMKTV